MSSSNESCTNLLGWDIVAAATDFSALSGLLAGFLIASAAVLFAPGGRCVPYTVAQLASGVPGLVLSSFIFSAISGLTDKDAANCDQTWSQGLIAIALLLIGATVLVCGFSWVLVTYSEDLEHILLSQFSRDGTDRTLIKGSQDFVEMVEKRSVLLVSLNGWISGSVIVASTIVLIRMNALYIQSGHYASDTLRKALIYLVTAIGVYVIVRSVYTISQRTLNALQRPLRKTHDMAREGWLLLMVVLSAIIPPWIAGYLGPLPFVVSLLIFTVIYCVGRMSYWQRLRKLRQTAKKQSPEEQSSNKNEHDAVPRAPFDVEDAEGPTAVGEDAASAIIWSEKLFQIGKLAETTYSVVLFALLGLVFAGVVMEKPLINGVRVSFTLFLGGVYPAAILLGLSRSVAAHDNNCAIPSVWTKSIGKWIP